MPQLIQNIRFWTKLLKYFKVQQGNPEPFVLYNSVQPTLDITKPYTEISAWKFSAPTFTIETIIPARPGQRFVITAFSITGMALVTNGYWALTIGTDEGSQVHRVCCPVGQAIDHRADLVCPIMVSENTAVQHNLASAGTGSEFYINVQGYYI